MPVKRKRAGADVAGLEKKFRRALDQDEDEAYQTDTASLHGSPFGHLPEGEIEDEVAAFTENGALRARSEARREWNQVCPFGGCGRRFNRPCRLEQHIRTHTKERPFACPFADCDKTFTRKDHVSRHAKDAHGNSQREFKCERPGCGLTFTQKDKLAAHERVHEGRLRCEGYPPCEQEFRKKEVLQRHIRSAHLGLRPYVCDHFDDETGRQCTESFDKKPALTRHIENEHGEPRFFCGICVSEAGIEPIETEAGVLALPTEMVGFRTQTELRAHTLEYHPPTCQYCSKTFTTEHSLRMHVDVAHEAPEPGLNQFPCPRPGCTRTFTRRGNLNVHIKAVHNEERNWSCSAFDISTSNVPEIRAWDRQNTCDFATMAKSTLEQHIRTQHLQSQNRKNTRKALRAAKKQQAEQNKAARVKRESILGNLTGRAYDEVRPVACLFSDCDRRFTMDRDLRRHLRAHHKLPDDEIEARIAERDALQGGPFWIGGDDGDDMFSAQLHAFNNNLDHSFEQYHSPYTTPDLSQSQTPYHMDGTNGFQNAGDEIPVDPLLGGFPEAKQVLYERMVEDEERDQEMLDREMGLEGLPAPVDVHTGMGMFE